MVREHFSVFCGGITLVKFSREVPVVFFKYLTLYTEPSLFSKVFCAYLRVGHLYASLRPYTLAKAYLCQHIMDIYVWMLSAQNAYYVHPRTYMNIAVHVCMHGNSHMNTCTYLFI